MKVKREYFSSRNNNKNISINQLHLRLLSLFEHFHAKDYFAEKLEIKGFEDALSANTLANVLLGFAPFPLHSWSPDDILEDNIFDTFEFLFDHISKPGDLVTMVSETNFSYEDYESYDQDTGQRNFSHMANVALRDYGVGYELTLDGKILAIGNEGLGQILKAEIVEYDEQNVDGKVRSAILKWRNRSLSWKARREAIRDLSDVFEWLKSNKDLEKVIKRKDDAALFNIANNFAIRHHAPKQIDNYEKEIWYPWIFHFYLATYHATIRLLKKYENE